MVNIWLMMVNNNLVGGHMDMFHFSCPCDFAREYTGWWYTYPSEKYEFVEIGMILPNIWINKSHVPNISKPPTILSP